MKKITLLAAFAAFTLFSCSSSDGENNQENPEFAMTAKINGNVFEANNPLGTNLFSDTTVFSYFPPEDYILLQGRMGGPFGNPEIELWLKKSDIVVGTYPIGPYTFSTPPSHFIDLIDLSNAEYEDTRSGTVTITDVNTSTKIVTGTFEFNTVDDLQDPNAPINFHITEGTFRYQYE